MPSPSRAAVAGSEFDAFLYSSIAEEENGMLLTVLSALARLDVDPWEEAARLTSLPREKATQTLTSMIAALPNSPSARRESAAIATRLIALLPRRVTSGISPPATGVAAAVGISTHSIKRYIVMYLIFMLFILASHWLQQAAAPASPPAATNVILAPTPVPAPSPTAASTPAAATSSAR